jgi:SNF2 family DNA or RNA helicase
MVQQGLGKTAQAIALLHHVRTVEHLRGPFLVVAPLSTLTHWQREIEEWSDLSVLLYHGSRESRELMLRHEFWMDAAAPPPPQPPQPPPPPQPAVRPMQITLPDGVVAGQQVQVVTPVGRMVIVVPPGAVPGSQLVVNVPNAPPPPQPASSATGAASGAGGGSSRARAGAAPQRRLHQFHVLLTSYETLRDDLELLGSIDWRVAVIDEGAPARRSTPAAVRGVEVVCCMCVRPGPREQRIGSRTRTRRRRPSCARCVSSTR